MGFGCTAVSPPAKIRIFFVQSEKLTGFGTFFCSFLVADLLGNILANLLGDRLALLSWLLPRNVAAVLHLLGDNIHLLEVFLLLFFCLFLCLFWFSCFCFCVHLVLARNLLALGGLNLPCNLDNDNVDNFFCNLETRVPTIREIVFTSVICDHNSCQNRDMEICFDITCFECELELGIEM